MFDPSDTARLFGCAPGVDFPLAVVRGLEQRLETAPPEAWARVTLLVNTTRMARRLRDLFDQGPARLLPRIRMITQIDDLCPHAPMPPAATPLRRRLELAQLIKTLIENQPELAPDAGPFDLADSLATLLDEMQGEGVSADDIARLDVSDQSGHWARAQQFIAIAQRYINDSQSAPDPEARQRETVLRLAEHWAQTPPHDPILIVGSTGSRGTTLRLMEAVARLPEGAVILPGLDDHMPHHVWNTLAEDKTAEDHPQYRFLHLCEALGLHPSDVEQWTGLPPASDARNALVSLALRPAPVTDAWRDEGPKLVDLDAATDAITLVEADTPRTEAIAIAMRLRQAAEDGQKAALITPDRMLTRQVTAALDRWELVPDDSAGTPLHLSPPGRFLRHVAGLFQATLDAEALLTLLKHPLTHSGANRNLHQLNTQRLELRMRRDGLPYPEADSLKRCAQKATRQVEEIAPWADWVADLLCDGETTGLLPLEVWVTRHRALAEALAEGPDGADADELWQKKAGQAALKVMEGLADAAAHGGDMSAGDYAGLVATALRQGDDVRDRDTPHPNIMIWGTLEARVQGADLVILAGLNDGTWPEAPTPDPWLNRKMRFDAGLLLPERRIGLSAHDFQQAIAAPKVWLTRSIRSDDAETVPSRWMNRLRNLLQGLVASGHTDHWKTMRARGDHWLALARQLDAAPDMPKAHRPSPCPPVSTRPRRLTVTEIQTLIRDPYATYAKHVLRLRALRPLVQTPDALLRGILSHDVMEQFVRDTMKNAEHLTTDALMQHARHVLNRDVPWPAARALWLARFERAAAWIVETEHLRQMRATPILFEEEAKGKLALPAIRTELEGRADRIDVDETGAVILYDYKTGSPPTKDQQKHFDKQLLIEAAMVEEGGFAALGPRPVRAAQFIGIGSTPKIEDAPLDVETPRQVLADLVGLLSAYLEGDKGYTSRRALYEDREARDYDQLARFGEWDVTQDPMPEVLT
ncbi:double-strand break repair protein AddB [Tateyamaria omphalii]|uniref:Double-strand break repair protein AddB n=1 Tax=Tateyamaria omphalii TaxID=299262 RepID=A0A1P8MYU9_9RHOB|nr:double-strand break repair protein AddB [Tateyamaria omphalii]APX13099.1 double-strand break repair protein AddB [Tateyamaria omphalii]